MKVMTFSEKGQNKSYAKTLFCTFPKIKTAF